MAWRKNFKLQNEKPRKIQIIKYTMHYLLNSRKILTFILIFFSWLLVRRRREQKNSKKRHIEICMCHQQDFFLLSLYIHTVTLPMLVKLPLNVYIQRINLSIEEEWSHWKRDLKRFISCDFSQYLKTKFWKYSKKAIYPSREKIVWGQGI